MDHCPNFIKELKPNSVLVLGSNLEGFHGAGAAGFAMRGTTRNNWRDDKKFLAAMKSPPGSPKRKGRWAVFGIGKGYQEGLVGASYAIATVTRPGRSKSIPLSRILEQFKELGEFAKKHPEMTFYVVVAGGGYSGWTTKEMQTIYKKWCKDAPPPFNIKLKREYEFRTEESEGI